MVITPEARRAVIVHGARDVAATLEVAAGRPVALLSAPGVAGYLGVAGFVALLAPHGALPLAILDAAGAPGHALAALRAGLPQVVLDPASPAFDALAELAVGLGARLLPAAPPALDLARVDLRKPQGVCHLSRWLDLP
ncbi:MAG: hypothetical protein K5Q68_10630 [Roseococcus sp.]|nr:hypothetical protein [Roseococcus sp.]